MIHLANTTAPHVTSQKQPVLDLYRSQNMPQPKPPFTQQLTQHIAHRPIPAPEPNPEPNPRPDGAAPGSHTNISPVDWDELFHAVQQRLEHCVDDALYRTPELALHNRHQVTKVAVLDCVAAMKQLHQSLALERQEWQELKAKHKKNQQVQQQLPEQLQQH